MRMFQHNVFCEGLYIILCVLYLIFPYFAPLLLCNTRGRIRPGFALYSKIYYLKNGALEHIITDCSTKIHGVNHIAFRSSMPQISLHY